MKNNDSKNCTVADGKLKGSGLTFTRVCSNPHGSRVTFSGDVTFTSAEWYHGVFHMTSDGHVTNPCSRAPPSL
jgi:hypothetical protein